MQYDFTAFKKHEKDTRKWLEDAYTQIQAGRVGTAMLDQVKVTVYGTKTMLRHCSTITTEDQKTVVIVPYDTSLLPDIEKALREQIPPSMNISIGETSVRLIAPDITGEHRIMLEKVAREKADEAKQSIRGAREKVLSDIKQKKAKSEISEDEEFAIKKELQDMINSTAKDIEEACKNKINDMQK